MAEGNGADVGSMYGLLVDVAKKVSQQEAVLERHGAMLERHGAMLEKIGTLLVQHDGRLRDLEANMATRADIAELKRTVEGYHSSVVGNGNLASELEGRVHRVEVHLGLPPFVHG